MWREFVNIEWSNFSFEFVWFFLHFIDVILIANIVYSSIDQCYSNRSMKCTYCANLSVENVREKLFSRTYLSPHQQIISNSNGYFNPFIHHFIFFHVVRRYDIIGTTHKLGMDKYLQLQNGKNRKQVNWFRKQTLFLFITVNICPWESANKKCNIL